MRTIVRLLEVCGYAIVKTVETKTKQDKQVQDLKKLLSIYKGLEDSQKLKANAAVLRTIQRKRVTNLTSSAAALDRSEAGSVSK